MKCLKYMSKKQIAIKTAFKIELLQGKSQSSCKKSSSPPRDQALLIPEEQKEIYPNLVHRVMKIGKILSRHKMGPPHRHQQCFVLSLHVCAITLCISYFCTSRVEFKEVTVQQYCPTSTKKKLKTRVELH